MGMLRRCAAPGCEVLTLGERCCEHETAAGRREWPRGRPFPGPAPSKGGGLPASARVLVVDDDRSLRRVVSRALELEGYEVEAAVDGVEAVAFFEADGRQEPALVVLDVLMPNLDGLAACRMIR